MTLPVYDYAGAHVLVTGGTSGIGAATAAGFRAAGAEVTITGTRPTPGDYDVDLSAYRYLQLDVEDDASVDAVAGALTRLDVLVNNAGIALPATGLDEWEPEIFDRSVKMLLTSAFRMSQRTVHLLEKSTFAGGASVMGIASLSSFFGIPMVVGYGAAKTGLVGLTRTLAVEWGAKNIRVNAVAAGLVKTGMTAGTFANPEWTQPSLARTPLGRLGAPDDIANAILFLSSPAASWITGQTLCVDGGYTVFG